MIFKNYEKWLTETQSNAELQRELKGIEGNPTAIEDRFYRELAFGTGGLRGILGAGTNRMNVYTVAKATQGYSNYLHKAFMQPSVAIGYDSRIHSDLFAETAATVFAANGIKVYLYQRLMPTPAVSFAVRDLNCAGGVVVTASHNPSEYNGYKVYGHDGCQITTETAKTIQKEIDTIDPFLDVKQGDFQQLLASGMISYIENKTIEHYLDAVSKSSILPAGIPKDVSIVYTPLNGAGISCVPSSLRQNGFTNITLVEEQKNPDGHFPTCPYPNPEIREALDVGLQWANKTGSDLLLATDPDCDRVGVAVRHGGTYTLITGNEMGVLLLDFICKMRLAAGTMPNNPVAVKTIVTTPMAIQIARYYRVELRDVLTGFKFIGEQIGQLEEDGQTDRYIFGFEESYGYLSNSFVRDKDAVNAALLICEMFVYYKSQGKSLLDVLAELYRTFGFYQSRLLSLVFEGSAGYFAMQSLMRALRANPPKEIAKYRVEKIIDYSTDNTGLPKSDVIRIFLADGQEAVVRPSGTEPKLKIYITTVAETLEKSQANAQLLSEYFNEWARNN